MCPLCRHHADEPEGRKLLRCPEHADRVLVPTAALAEADGDPFLGMVIAERFSVLELLGAGSMGTVYRARQDKVGRDVALKVVRSDRLVDPQAKGRFQQEAHATSLLTSPHTVTVFDFGEVRVTGDDPHFIDGSLFLAMELLDGESLGTRLKRAGRIQPKDAVGIVRQALLSLSEAHEKGVIHRDLKPDNLVLTRTATGEEEICKVLDFGIAKVLTNQGDIDALETQAGTVFGTPRYMSPEQAQGKPLDARSDIYSLGVILYHMLLGSPPYTDGDAVVVMAHHIKTIPKRPNRVDADLGLPHSLEDLLMRVLSKRPDDRPQSAQAFIEELDGLGSLARETTTSEMTAIVRSSAPPGFARRRRVIVGVGVTAIGGLIAAAAFTSARSQPAETLTAFLSPVAASVAVDAVEASRRSSLIEAADTAENEATAPAESAAPPTTAPTAPAAAPKPRTYERFDDR